MIQKSAHRPTTGISPDTFEMAQIDRVARVMRPYLEALP
jgi:hypothetical protein